MSQIPAFPYALLWDERVVRRVANLTREDGVAFLAVAARQRLRVDATPVRARAGQHGPERSARGPPAGSRGARPMTSLDRRFVAQQRVVGRVLVLALTIATVLVLLIVFAAADSLATRARVVLGVCWLAAVVVGAWAAERWPALQDAHIGYQLDEDGLLVRHGVLWQTFTHVPRSRVQHTDVSQGPIERGYGLGHAHRLHGRHRPRARRGRARSRDGAGYPRSPAADGSERCRLTAGSIPRRSCFASARRSGSSSCPGCCCSSPRGLVGLGLASVDAVVLIVPAYTLVAIAHYVSLRYRYEPAEMVIRTGLLFRNERHIPYARIQNLDAVQNVLHRLLRGGGGQGRDRWRTGAGGHPQRPSARGARRDATGTCWVF